MKSENLALIGLFVTLSVLIITTGVVTVINKNNLIKNGYCEKSVVGSNHFLIVKCEVLK